MHFNSFQAPRARNRKKKKIQLHIKIYKVHRQLSRHPQSWTHGDFFFIETLISGGFEGLKKSRQTRTKRIGNVVYRGQTILQFAIVKCIHFFAVKIEKKKN